MSQIPLGYTEAVYKARNMNKYTISQSYTRVFYNMSTYLKSRKLKKSVMSTYLKHVEIINFRVPKKCDTPFDRSLKV